MGEPWEPQEFHDNHPQHGRRDFLDWGISFYEGILARSPNHVDVLQVLGLLYTETGDYEKGLEADQRLSIIRPTDPVALYNLACSHALLRQNDEALDALEQAVMLGFVDFEKVSSDPDLSSLHETDRFKSILSSIKSSESGA